MSEETAEDPSLGWTLEQARSLLNYLEPQLAAVGYHVGLMGSVLLRGESSKDLDIIIYPHNKMVQDIPRVHAVLVSLELKQQADIVNVLKTWKFRAGVTDSKHVEVWKTPGKKRIDVFFFS